MYRILLYELPEEHQHFLMAGNLLGGIWEVGAVRANGIAQKLLHGFVDPLILADLVDAFEIFHEYVFSSTVSHYKW